MIPGDMEFVSDCKVLSIASVPNPVHLIDYRIANYSDRLYEQFNISKPANLSTWISQRRAQFLSGRLAAKQALNSAAKTSNIADSLTGPDKIFLANEQAASQVLIGKHREPLWPDSFVGSISHAQQTSIAIVSKQRKTRLSLGIDIQSIIAIETQLQIASTILTSQDESFIKQGNTRVAEPVLFTLIYSAKESFFKALFSRVGEYFDFDTVSLIEFNINARQLTLSTNKRLGEAVPQGFEVSVSFDVLDGPTPKVITVCRPEH